MEEATAARVLEHLEESKGVLNFRRFYLEMRDQGMEEYMKANLSQEDYLFWKEK